MKHLGQVAALAYSCCPDSLDVIKQLCGGMAAGVGRDSACKAWLLVGVPRIVQRIRPLTKQLHVSEI